MWRAIVVVSLSLLSPQRSAEATPTLNAKPTLTDYTYDGKTTYCFAQQQGVQIANLDPAYELKVGTQNECPMLLTMTQTTTGSIRPNSEVEYSFTATLNLNDNTFGMKQLEGMVRDPYNMIPAQIAHANIHACSRTTVCDIFTKGANPLATKQETANFTADGKAPFNQKLQFFRGGEYNVLAHVILPGKNPENSTFHFMTLLTTTIASDGSSSQGDQSSGMSSGATIGIIVGAVVAVVAVVGGIIFCRRRRSPMVPGNDHFRHSGFAPSHTTKNSRLDWNGDPEFQFGHDRYQASMVSQYSNKQPQGLSSSALMFQDNRSSRHTKPLSSGGSSHRSSGSPRHRDYRGGGKSTVELPEHGMGMYDAYYAQGAPDHRSDNGTYVSHSSVGTSDYSGGNAYSHPNGPPRYEGHGDPYPYDRESDMSSLNDYGYDDGHEHDDTYGTLRPVSEVSRDSAASMGTVDFDLPPPLHPPALRPTGDSFQAADVPNLADTQLTFNDDEISKQTIEYIDSLRKQNYRDTDQASDYVSDFGDTSRTFDFRDSAQSDLPYDSSFRSTDHQFTDTDYRLKKRAPSAADSESYEF